MNRLSDHRVLVTGGTGFIGSHLVHRLIADGCDVMVLVRRTDHLGRIEDVRTRIRVGQGDLCVAESLLDPVSSFRPEIVFHLAAYGVERPLDGFDDAIRVNVYGTCNLLRVVPKSLSAFVYTGTDFEYGPGEGLRTEKDLPRPTNYYAASKTAGWLTCCAFLATDRLPVVGVRPFLTYGPSQGIRRLLPSIVCGALRNEDIPLTRGVQVRDFVYVDDVVEGLIRAATTEGISGEIFNLGTGVGTSLQAMAEMILQIVGSTSKPLFGALPYRQGEIWDLRADISKSRTVLDWEPKTTVREGLWKTIEWYRATLQLGSVRAR